MSTFTLHIKMLSDWRIGSGKGRQGAVNELVQRDGDGFPFISVSTLRGVWRDAAEQLAFALDNGTSGKWQNAVSHLFGSQPAFDDRGKQGRTPVASSLTVTPARMEKAIRERLCGDTKKPLRNALTFIKPGVGIDPETGSAKHDMLRFIEVSRQGAVLKCAVTISDSRLVPLAICSAVMIQSIGGERRRGAGRCKVTIDGGMKLEEAVKTLQGDAPKFDPDSVDQSAREPKYGEPGSGGFIRYPLTIKLLSPVIVPDEILGNTVTTRDHIPGTLLIGPVLKVLGLKGMDRHIVNGDLRVLPAYPQADGKRSSPTPLCWRQKKDDGDSPEMVNKVIKDHSDNEAWKAPGASFCLLENKTPRFARKSISIFIHNTVEDNSQTPKSDVGGVYTYEALSAGQVFAAELWLRDGVTVNFNKTRSGTAHIGRAVNAGYGEVEIEIGEGEPVKARNGAADGRTILYFASDCILPSALSPEKGIETLLENAGVKDAVIGKAFIKTVRHEGWMPRAGLPRPSLIAIQAGSVVELESVSGDLKAMAREGLGARQAEGFGVVEVNPEIAIAPLEKSGGEVTRKSHETSSEQTEANNTNLTNNAKKFIETVQDACLRQWIRTRAEEFADDVGKRETLIGKTNKSNSANDEKTKMSQLGNLRAMMGLLEDDGAVATVAMWLQAQGEKWMKPFMPLFNSSDTIWDMIGKIPDELVVLKDKIDEKKLERYAILSTVHASIRAHKRKLEDEAKSKTKPEAA